VHCTGTCVCGCVCVCLQEQREQCIGTASGRRTLRNFFCALPWDAAPTPSAWHADVHVLKCVHRSGHNSQLARTPITRGKVSLQPTCSRVRGTVRLQSALNNGAVGEGHVRVPPHDEDRLGAFLGQLWLHLQHPGVVLHALHGGAT